MPDPWHSIADTLAELDAPPPPPERDWIVTVHSTTGSTMEAIEARAGLGPFTEDEARQLEKQLNLIISAHIPGGEVFAVMQHFTPFTDLPAATDANGNPGVDLTTWFSTALEDYLP